MVAIKKKMYVKSIIYALAMAFFAILTYLFLDSGFNTKTIVKVNYETDSDVYYKVKYLDDNYSNNSQKYISSMVDYIDFDYEYNNILSEYVSGYYKYNIEGYLIAYKEDITDSLWEKEYKLVNDKIVLLDQNNINNIKIKNVLRVDFKTYREEILNFIEKYGIDISGYLSIKINILESLNFDYLNKEYDDNKAITINIPLTDEIFKISIKNIDDSDSYYEFSNKVPMNIIFLIIGTFLFAISFSFLVMVIRQFVLIYKKESDYNKKLRRLLFKYDDIIVRVNKLYVNKKHNMIYVDSFKELLDVYDKRNKIINFKEVKRGKESIFLIIDDDNAWIYKLF